jgi:hypothetical protein
MEIGWTDYGSTPRLNTLLIWSMSEETNMKPDLEQKTIIN